MALILPFAKFIIHDNNLTSFYYHPVRAFRQAFTEQDIHFIQDTGGTIIPSLFTSSACNNSSRRLINSAASSRLITRLTDNFRPKREYLSAYVSGSIPHASRYRASAWHYRKESFFPCRRNCKRSSGETEYRRLMGDFSCGIFFCRSVRNWMPPFAPFKGIILDIRLHPPAHNRSAMEVIFSTFTFLVDLPRTGRIRSVLLSNG